MRGMITVIISVDRRGARRGWSEDRAEGTVKGIGGRARYKPRVMSLREQRGLGNY